MYDKNVVQNEIISEDFKGIYNSSGNMIIYGKYGVISKEKKYFFQFSIFINNSGVTENLISHNFPKKENLLFINGNLLSAKKSIDKINESKACKEEFNQTLKRKKIEIENKKLNLIKTKANNNVEKINGLKNGKKSVSPLWLLSGLLLVVGLFAIELKKVDTKSQNTEIYNLSFIEGAKKRRYLFFSITVIIALIIYNIFKQNLYKAYF